MKITGLVLLLSGAAFLDAGGWPLWLDSPTRDNRNDPKSIFKPTPPPANTATLLPTLTTTPTPTITVTAPGTFTWTPTTSPTPTATNSFTPSPTFSPSPTYTPLPPNKLYYDGETAGNAVSSGGSTNSSVATNGMLGIAELAGTGALGTAHYLEITMTAAGPGTNWGQAAFVNMVSPMDVSTYDTLSFYVRIPRAGCSGVFRPMVQLNTNAAGFPNDRSNPVTISAYLVGATTLGYDQWINVQVPISAMLGGNWNGGTFPAADLTSVVGVQFRSWGEGASAGHGMFNPPTFDSFIGKATLDVDEIRFLKLGAGAPALRNFSPVVDDFQMIGNTLWNSGVWTVDQDGQTCPPTAPTTVTFPAAGNSPVDVSGNTYTCHVGHFQGSLNAVPDTTCNTDMPHARIYTFLGQSGNGGNGVDVSGGGGNMLAAFMPTGATGLSVTMKTGAKTGQCYEVHLGTVASWNQPGRNDFMFLVCDSYFTAANTWQTIKVPFPADGSVPGFNADPHPYVTSDLFWTQGINGGQAALPWDRSTLHLVAISAMNGGAFDIWVNNISFY